MSIYDFSEYQGTIDFGKVKGNADLIILRVQAGSSHPDKNYPTYASQCKSSGISFGSYAYGKFLSVADAQQEAKDCFARIDKATQFVVIDVESVSTTVASQLVPATQAFIDYLHAQGIKKVGLYSGEGFYKANGLSSVKADFLWIANYGVDDGKQHTKPSIPCDLWQYSDKATESGVIGYVDIDTISGTKTLDYFTGKLVLDIATTIPSQPQPQLPSLPPVFCMKSTIYAKVQSVGGNDIRKAPTHNSEFVRNTNDNEVFDAYDFVNGFFNVGQDNWIDSNGGKNAHIIQTFYSSPVDPFQKPYDPKRNVCYAEVKTVKNNDVRKAPTHNSDYVRSTGDGEVLGAYDFVNGFFNVGGDNWIDSNGGKNAYIIKNYFPEPQPYKEPVPAPVVAPVKPVVVPAQPSANASITPSANVDIQTSGSVTVKVSGNTVISGNTATGNLVVSGNVISTGSLAQQIEEAVMKDPQLQKNFTKKVLDFFVSLFK